MENDFKEQCRWMVRKTLASRGWGLVQDEVGFVAEVLVEIEARSSTAQSRPMETIIEQASIKRYGHVWYMACRTDGTSRQRQAFEELNRLLYRVAFNRIDHDEYLAQECAQIALVRIWQNLGQVVDPGSFMWWALRVVNNVVNRQFTAGKRKVRDPKTGTATWLQIEITASDAQVADQTPEAETILENTTTLARLNGLPIDQEPAMTDETRLKLEAAIQVCLDNERHRAVIIKTFLDAKSRQEVATELGTTPEIVSVFKQRALRYLKECEVFLAVLEELL